MRERYWTFFYSIKHEAFYYKHFQQLFRKVNWCITAFLCVTSLSCIAVWDFWKNYQILWAILICAAQVIQALFPKLLYNDLLIPTQFMISALDHLLIEIEHDWLYIDIHNLSDDEILERLERHQLKYSELVKSRPATTPTRLFKGGGGGAPGPKYSIPCPKPKTQK